MIVTCVHVYVKPEYVQQFIEASKINHQHSIIEPTNLRFDILQSTDDPTRFLLYEAYESEEGAQAHKQTSHYLTWRTTVEPWMAQPRQGIPYRFIAPTSRNES
ncbi:MAG: antibiotic biosynthesis monooxygenase [Gammaproteobacteria bacterium]|jgi:autoinducer 2-degrading protein